VDSEANQLKTLHQQDTIVIEKLTLDESIIKNYAEILEKTNSQLSLWWNPYAVLIATLGILFALMAIIAAVIIYRQSNDYKKLINKSLTDHQKALDKLIEEKNNQLENDKKRLDVLIMEYTEKLNKAGVRSKQEISEFIKKLEEQKDSIDPQIRSYKHSGWNQKDINERYSLDTNTIFNAKVTLNSVGQAFVIYLRVNCADSKTRWLGFAGNLPTPVNNPTEYTKVNTSDSKTISFSFSENIVSYYMQGFSDTNTVPLEVDCIRLRGSDSDMSDIFFSYKII